ncbi:MAG: hypothetical protein GFH27_549311n52 [Chloroflexi bacterium AL-W]|nr:hypothetical protein [Chloroflexi bacterium AL-N1]NOK68770.1 hypothetical protein [Chloroflexi bacterium AL-N10]NOK76256.1 hypothetical protein [Chloroflexi bacterium AL-N5]NOK84107.1 hypothetical protein [Chloroflexi bacterium AL-W]NOK91394.1 hypothetical protein [Chloroflexi bacterium AL-N15]
MGTDPAVAPSCLRQARVGSGGPPTGLAKGIRPIPEMLDLHPGRRLHHRGPLAGGGQRPDADYLVVRAAPMGAKAALQQALRERLTGRRSPRGKGDRVRALGDPLVTPRQQALPGPLRQRARNARCRQLPPIAQGLGIAQQRMDAAGVRGDNELLEHGTTARVPTRACFLGHAILCQQGASWHTDGRVAGAHRAS